MYNVDKTITLSTNGNAQAPMECCISYTYSAPLSAHRQGGLAVSPAASAQITKIHVYTLVRGKVGLVDMTDIFKAALADEFWMAVAQEIADEHE